MDFDDLLLRTNELLTRFPEVLAKYQDRFRYILVDEYQDTNHSQYLIVKALSSKFENICVVGDDAQSIYSFRGANIYNILNFQERLSRCQNRFSGAKLPFYAEYCQRCECGHCQETKNSSKKCIQ